MSNLESNPALELTRPTSDGRFRPLSRQAAATAATAAPSSAATATAAAASAASAATSSTSSAIRAFRFASLLLIGSWMVSGGFGPQLVAAAPFSGFNSPTCPCRPHHPLHPQMAFCNSDFVLKVRFLREIKTGSSEDGGSRHYWVSVLRVFRNRRGVPGLTVRSRLSLWMHGTRDTCGAGITVRHYSAVPSMISRHVELKQTYLVTGNLENGRMTLSVCSWIAYWPNRKARKELPAEELVSNVVTKQQSRYLRQGLYEKGCSKCAIEDSPSPGDSGTCRFDSSTDYYMCQAGYTYCAHIVNPYSRTSGCEWHSDSGDRYMSCATQNIQIKAQKSGVKG